MFLIDKLKQWYAVRRIKKCSLVDVDSVFYPSSAVVNLRNSKAAIRVGGSTHVRGELLVLAHGGDIEIGEFCYIGEGAKIWSGKSIRIGNRVLIAHGVTILDNISHPIDPRERHEHFRKIISSGHPCDIDLRDRSVVISDDAWIGCMSVILPGVTIGEGAIVGAGSVVTKDVAPHTVVGGNPAVFIRSFKQQNSRGEV